jgi:molecular chaperone DnaK
MIWLITRGATLPGRKLITWRTSVALSRGQTGQVLFFPVRQGENKRADRNTLIGHLELSVEGIKRDLPIGSSVEVTIDIDRAQTVRLKAYVPVLDEEYETKFDYTDYRRQATEPEQLRGDVEREIRRLEARIKAQETGGGKAIQVLRRIEKEGMVQEVESSLAAARGDRDAADTCLSGLLEMRRTIDEVEGAVEWPVLLARAEGEISIERNLITDEQYGATAEEKSLFAMLEREIRAAMDSGDPELLEGRIDKMDSLGYRITQRQPGWWVAQLDNLEKRKHTMIDQSKAEAYVTQARGAISNNDLESLKAAVRQLGGMLPPRVSQGRPNPLLGLSDLERDRP